MILRPAFLIGAIALLLAASLPVLAQDVPVEKYSLPNGMTVILHVDHSLPVATINIWYRVGSKDELPQRSGFAHLFEHLMFMGTERVPNGDFDRLMEAGGGANNASTSSDRTDYYSSGPAALLPTLLWLDADRLEDLARAMDSKKVDLQRDVVLNELRQSYENRPYGRANLAIEYLLYPLDHPYHYSAIGTEADLKAAQVSDVKDFFATYYVPNNASLVVAGDFDPARIKPLIARLFGTLPRGAEPPRRPVSAFKLGGIKRGVMYDKVQLPQISFAYLAPKGYGPGDAESDLLGLLLTEGKSSRLYKRLVIDEHLASSVSAYNDSGYLGSMFRIDVQTTQDADLDRVERIVDEELERFLKSGPTSAELEQRKAPIELSMLSGLQSLSSKAAAMNRYEFFWGEPNSFRRDLDRYRNATPAGVLANARQVLTQNARVIYRVLPEQPRRVAGPRDTRPTDGAPAAFVPPPPERFKLSNGIPVELWKTSALPLTSVSVVFRAGGPLVTDAAQAGVAALTANMLDEGAGDLDTLQFSEAIASLGGKFEAGSATESLHADLTVLSRNFGKGLDLLADAVRAPRMQAADFERVKRLTLEEIVQSEEEPGLVASRVVARRLFGAEHPYAWPSHGTRESVGNLSLDAVKTTQAQLLRPDLATILVAGNLSAAEAKTALEKSFGGWRATGPKTVRMPAPARYATSDQKALQVYLVDRPDAPQTSVRFAAPSPRYDDPSRVKLRALGTLLGGTFTSRLNQNLREKHGYTYGAGAGFSPGPVLGTFAAASDVTAKDTGAAVQEFLAEFARLGNGDVTEAEAGTARESIKSDVVDTLSSNGGFIDTASGLLDDGAEFDNLGKDLIALGNESSASLNPTAKAAIDLDHAVLVLVGDRKTILPQLKAIGLPEPVQVDTWGEPLATH